MDQYNAFREIIENDGIAYGARASTFSTTVIEIYGKLGFDFVWLDFEHMGPSPYDSTVFENLTRAAEVGDTELLVRIPSGDPPLIRKILDAGVRNILVPRVNDADEVRAAVRATRFIYEDRPGERGMASARSSTWGDAEGYVATEDDEVCLGVMVEKMTAVDELEEILSVPELGFVFVGPSDLSIQLGHPTDNQHPDVSEQVNTIQRVCQSSDIPMGGIADNPSDISRAIEEGYQILRIGGDVESIKQTLGQRLTQARDKS